MSSFSERCKWGQLLSLEDMYVLTALEISSPRPDTGAMLRNKFGCKGFKGPKKED